MIFHSCLDSHLSTRFLSLSLIGCRKTLSNVGLWRPWKFFFFRKGHTNKVKWLDFTPFTVGFSSYLFLAGNRHKPMGNNPSYTLSAAVRMHTLCVHKYSLKAKWLVLHLLLVKKTFQHWRSSIKQHDTDLFPIYLLTCGMFQTGVVSFYWVFFVRFFFYSKLIICRLPNGVKVSTTCTAGSDRFDISSQSAGDRSRV